MNHEEQYQLASKRADLEEKSKAEAEAIMKLAGFTVSRVWELANGYWPRHPDYDNVRRPWWLFMTEIGPIQIGWRKRVISIRWDATSVRGEVTKDEVTKGDDHVHAWSTEKAVEYLKALRALPRTGADGGAK